MWWLASIANLSQEVEHHQMMSAHSHRQTKLHALLLTLLSRSNMSLKNINHYRYKEKGFNVFDSIVLLFSYKSKFYCKSQLYYQYGLSVCLHTTFKRGKNKYCFHLFPYPCHSKPVWHSVLCGTQTRCFEEC